MENEKQNETIIPEWSIQELIGNNNNFFINLKYKNKQPEEMLERIKLVDK